MKLGSLARRGASIVTPTDFGITLVTKMSVRVMCLPTKNGNVLADEESARREVGLEGAECTRLALNETSVCPRLNKFSLGKSTFK